MMKHATIEIDEDLDEALAIYGQERGLLGGAEALAQAALRDLLADQGYLVPFRPFFVSLAESDDTATDLSINHDRYLTEGDAGGSG